MAKKHHPKPALSFLKGKAVPSKPSAKSAPAKTAKRKSKSSKSTGMDAPVSPAGGEQRTLSIAKISNGYLVSESGYSRGKYTSRQTYTPNRPKLSFPPATKAGK